MPIMRQIQRKTSFMNSVRCKRNGDHGDESKSYSLRYGNDWKFDDFLKAASNLLDIYPPAQRAFNGFGTEITDVLMFGESGTVVYLASGTNEAFIPVPSLTDDTTLDLKWGLPAMMGTFKVGSVLDCTTNTKYPRTVALVTNESTGEQCVCKFIPKAALDDMEVVSNLSMELRCLAALSHPNIMQFQRREDAACHVVLVFDPWFGSNMRTHVVNHGVLTEDQTQTVITQVSSALIHMHLKGVTHGTICLDKIVMKVPDQLDHVMLTGFHQASSLKGEEAFQMPSVVDVNVPYTAPEGFGTSPVLAAPMDVWALGVVYFALLHGHYPFGGGALAADTTLLSVPSLHATAFHIKTGAYTVDPTLSPACRFAIRRAFTLDARSRPNASEALRLFEGTIPIPPAFMSPAGTVETLTPAGGSGEKMDGGEKPSAHGNGSDKVCSHDNKSHSSEKSVRFPLIAPISRGRTSRSFSAIWEGATLFVGDPMDTLPAFTSASTSDAVSADAVSASVSAPLSTPTQAEAYAKLTQKALSTLDRAQCAANQGKRMVETRGLGLDLHRVDLHRSDLRAGGVGVGVGAGGGGVSIAAGGGVGVTGTGPSSRPNHLRGPSRANSCCTSRSSSTRSSFNSNNGGSASEKVPRSVSVGAICSALSTDDDDDEDDCGTVQPTRPRFKAHELLMSGKVYLSEEMA